MRGLLQTGCKAMTTRADKRAPRSSEGKRSKTSLRELAALFLKLGTIAFGGPAAHIAMMEDEVVRRRRWMTHDEFLDLLGATNLIPGPNSTEMAIHIGHRRAGWKGLVVAGASFILPAVLIVTGFAWAYVRYGSIPPSQGCPLRSKAGHHRDRSAGAVVARTRGHENQTPDKDRHCGSHSHLFRAPRTSCSSWRWFDSGSCTIDRASDQRSTKPPVAGFRIAFDCLPTIRSDQRGDSFLQLGAVVSFFLKVGAVLYGSGYVLLAFIRADLVERWHWLTESQLLDAIAVGQVTPGPVFTTATFIGYVLGGTKGAAVATLGIFLPAFVFVAASGPLVPRIRRSPTAGAFLDGVNATALALMVVVTQQLGRAQSSTSLPSHSR
jgi:chromate transporter